MWFFLTCVIFNGVKFNFRYWCQFYQVDYYFDHGVFLFRSAFCYQQCKRNECGIVNALVVHIVIENAVLIHKPKKNNVAAITFVAVAEAVVFW